MTSHPLIEAKLQDWGGCYVLDLPAGISCSELSAFLDSIAARIVKRKRTGVVVNMAGWDALDSAMIDAIERFIDVISVLGFQTVLAGFQPQCAVAMAELGLSFRPGTPCERDIPEAVDLLCMP